MWIRPGSDVVFRSRRRAASVPAEDVRVNRYDVGSGVGANKARVIANYAHEDSDAIASASKRNDREFLYEVSAKMANLANPVSLPVPPMRTPSRDRSPSVRSRPPLPSPSPVGSSSNYLRRVAALTPDDNYEIAAYLERSPTSRPAYTSSAVGGYRRTGAAAGRSASLPPVGLHYPSTASHPSVPRWYPSSAFYYGRPTGGWSTAGGRGGGSSSMPTGLPPRAPTGDRLDAMTDSVVGVAHTALYGDIVIGIPYKKRYMYSAQRDFDDLDTQSLPATHVPLHSSRLTSTAPHHFVNTRPASIALPAGAPDMTRPYSRASYAGPAGGGVGYGYRPPVHRAGYQPATAGLYPSSADVDDMISIKSYPGARTTTHRPLTGRTALHHHGNDLENDVDMLDFDDSEAISQFSSLRKDAKSMLSRYSLPPPTSNGPKHLTSTELDHKYGQIVSSMQAQNRLPPRNDYSVSTSSAPPVYPTSSNKRPMSDTRRKLRDLLCKSRKDPHYFDD